MSWIEAFLAAMTIVGAILLAIAFAWMVWTAFGINPVWALLIAGGILVLTWAIRRSANG